MDPDECRSAEGQAEPRLHHLIQRSRAHRPHRDALQPLVGERAVEAQRHRDIGWSANRKEEADRLVLEPASDELEHFRRRTVEPLDIVDRDDERT